MRTEAAKDVLLRAALRCLLAQMEEERGDTAADAEYWGERLAFAARDLATATDALPADRRPVGWSA